MSLAQVMIGLFVGGISAQALLAVVLVARRMWRRFPIFTAYSIFSFLQSIATLALMRHPAALAYTYWVCEVTGMFLGLGVVYEVFRDLFTSYASLRKMATQIFQWTALGLVLTGCIVILTHSAVEGRRLMAGFFVVEEGIRIIEVGLLLALFAFSGAVGLHWRKYAFGIAFGLAVFAMMELLAIALRTHIGLKASPAFVVTRSSAFDFSLLVWIGYMVARERVASGTAADSRSQLQQWEQALKQFVYQ